MKRKACITGVRVYTGARLRAGSKQVVKIVRLADSIDRQVFGIGREMVLTQLPCGQTRWQHRKELTEVRDGTHEKRGMVTPS